jgi:hypothetical protein
MKKHKRYSDIVNENKTIKEDNYIDKDLEDIRYYRGSILQFKDFWERKTGTKFNPHGEVNYEYPNSRKEEDKSLPYQDFVNGESPVVKHNLKTRKKGTK